MNALSGGNFSTSSSLKPVMGCGPVELAETPLPECQLLWIDACDWSAARDSCPFTTFDKVVGASPIGRDLPQNMS